MGRGLVLVARIAAQAVVEEAAEGFFGGLAPAAKGGGGADGVIDLAGRHQESEVGGSDLGVQIAERLAAGDAQFHRGDGPQKFGQQAVDFGADGIGGVTALGNPAHGHDATGIDGMKLHVDPGVERRQSSVTTLAAPPMTARSRASEVVLRRGSWKMYPAPSLWRRACISGTPSSTKVWKRSLAVG